MKLLNSTKNFREYSIVSFSLFFSVSLFPIYPFFIPPLLPSLFMRLQTPVCVRTEVTDHRLPGLYPVD